MIPVDQHDVQEVKIHTSTIKSTEDKYNEKYDALVAAGKEQEAEKLEPEMYFDEDKTGGYSGENLIWMWLQGQGKYGLNFQMIPSRMHPRLIATNAGWNKRRTVYGGAISSVKVTG